MFIMLKDENLVNCNHVEEFVFNDDRLTITTIFLSGRKIVTNYDNESDYLAAYIDMEKAFKL